MDFAYTENTEGQPVAGDSSAGVEIGGGLSEAPAEARYPNIYVPRSPLESICYDTLLQPGALVRIKAPSLMGKTRLMDYVLCRLAAQNFRTARLSLGLADSKVHFSDLNRFLRWLCINLGRELGMVNQIDAYWDETGMGSKVSCSTYMEEYLLAASDRPLVLCLDDVDLIFPYPEIYEDFFGLMRSWYEMARTRSRMAWKQLRLAIVHATDVYIQLNINQSPFNVGVPIELPEFTAEQAYALARRHSLSETPDLAPLMDMVGGHPYLLEQAFVHLKSHTAISLGQLLADAPTEAGIYANHLRDCWLKVCDNAELMKALTVVMTAKQAVQLDPVQAHQLQSMGLIKLTGNLAEPRCQLYHQYFKAQFGVDS
ncbi:MAG: AAA-like domain-containing protein [Leptolyngbyaceae cyanobacterium MO_188.B28]|nr:AAA-like domain-containing protein [Leptolyngbyaceae cyanobacterium MO_188.B28]